MQSENEHLRALVARLQSELERTQRQAGISAEAVAREAAGAFYSPPPLCTPSPVFICLSLLLSAEEGGMDLPPWAGDPEVMTPLLIAYDNRIQVSIAN